MGPLAVPHDSREWPARGVNDLAARRESERNCPDRIHNGGGPVRTFHREFVSGTSRGDGPRVGRPPALRPFGERSLLTGYWALSGYGLRATRALAWLVTAMATTIAVMVLWDLPVDDPKPQTTRQQVKAGQNLLLTTDAPDPRNPTGPLHARVTTDRFEKALRVVINSVVFRSSGQDLTTAGTYTEMTSRLAEPVLLGLAVLAIRSRIKG